MKYWLRVVQETSEWATGPGYLLDTPSGFVAQLAAAAKLLRLVEYGDHPELGPVLHREMRALLG